jgi:hypothetical protein
MQHDRHYDCKVGYLADSDTGGALLSFGNALIHRGDEWLLTTQVLIDRQSS